MSKTYRAIGKEMPDIEITGGQLRFADTGERTSMEELVKAGYYVLEKKCWCGGAVGPREPGDEDGLGCLDSIYHDWSSDGRPKEISRLYVAGPMSGYPNNNYGVFNQAAKLLEDAGYEVVNPAAFGAEGGHYVDLIRKDLELMLPCHGVAVLENWWESVGARNEVQVAGVLKMPVRTVIDWVELAAVRLKSKLETGS